MRGVLSFVLVILLLSCKQPVEKVVERFEDGSPMIILTYEDKNDTLNYQKKVLYNSGKLDYLGQFVDGEKSGTWIWWYENGNKKDQCKYAEGLYIDTVYHWYESGQLKQIEIPSEVHDSSTCNPCNGTVIQYFENGKIKAKLIRDNFTDNGLSISRKTVFDENGGWSIATYRNDSLNGETLEHNVDSTGKVIIVVGQYKDNKETGLWQWFNKDSVLYQSVYYEDGITSGLRKTYYPNGKVESEGSLKNGKYQGLVIYYDEQGKIVDKEYH
jgi:antitoxin component YwqK of YwqJK toxin-antitoxin module